MVPVSGRVTSCILDQSFSFRYILYHLGWGITILRSDSCSVAFYANNQSSLTFPTNPDSQETNGTLNEYIHNLIELNFFWYCLSTDSLTPKLPGNTFSELLNISGEILMKSRNNFMRRLYSCGPLNDKTF